MTRHLGTLNDEKRTATCSCDWESGQQDTIEQAVVLWNRHERAQRRLLAFAMLRHPAGKGKTHE